MTMRFRYGMKIATLLTRLLVASHFAYELVDKISRFDHWKEIIFNQANLGTWSLVLIIILLFVGCSTLIFGRYLWIGTFCLALFQIPTSIMFEDSLYESFDSCSAIGGVLAIALLHHKSKPSRRRSAGRESESDLLANLT